MVGAIFMVHLPNGFFMNWMGTQKGEGFEYHLLALAMAGALLLRGAGGFLAGPDVVEVNLEFSVGYIQPIQSRYGYEAAAELRSAWTAEGGRPYTQP